MTQGLTPLSAGEAMSNIAVDVILSIITCGIYNLFWQYRLFRTLNGFLGRPQFSWGLWFLLSIVTCGIFHLYYQYLKGSSICEIQQRYERPVNTSLPVLSVVLSLFSLSIAADAIHQHEINRFYEQS